MIATIDDVKKYWDDRPCNVRHSDKQIGTKQYFDEVERKRYTACLVGSEMCIRDRSCGVAKI